jgi:WhiB family transcriptional regulator, redox-sensing transcriptional regulator
VNDDVVTVTRYGLGGWAFFFVDEEVRVAATGWMLKAKCFNSGLGDLFVPKVGSKSAAEDRKRALAICNGVEDGRPCPVRSACAEYAVEHGISRGVWGGLSSRQLKLEIRERTRAGVPSLQYH